MADSSALGMLPSGGKGTPPSSARLSGRAKTQAKQNADAIAPPPNVTADQAQAAMMEIMPRLELLPQSQLTILKAACESRLVPAGLSVVVAKRRAIAQTLGGPNAGSSGSGQKPGKAKAKDKGDKPAPIFEPSMVAEINSQAEVAILSGHMSRLFMDPIEGETPSQSLKKDFKNLSLVEFTTKYKEGAKLERHKAIALARSKVHLAKLEVQQALKAQKSSGTKMGEDELKSLVEKATSSAQPFYLGKQAKGQKRKDDGKDGGQASGRPEKSPMREKLPDVTMQG